MPRPDLPSHNPAPSDDTLRDYYMALSGAPRAKTYMETRRRQDKLARRFERQWFKKVKRLLPQPAYIWLVTLTAIEVPDWAIEKSLTDFDPEPQRIWMRARRVANRLMDEDRRAGGHPTRQRVEARRCKVCRRLKIAFQAVERREFEKAWPTNWTKPCDDDCLKIKELKRGRKAV